MVRYDPFTLCLHDNSIFSGRMTYLSITRECKIHVQVRPDTTKLLKENIGNEFLNIRISEIFSGIVSLGKQNQK